jgi:ABC-type uncharacterized transport system substrate-binding protein
VKIGLTVSGVGGHFSDMARCPDLSPLLGVERTSSARSSRHLAIVSVSTSPSQMREDSGNYISVFLAELRRLGQIEGQNLTIERYGKERYLSDTAALAAQVVRSNPDVIYVIDPNASFFQRETSKIPIVTITNDPVAAGFAQNLASPRRQHYRC